MSDDEEQEALPPLTQPRLAGLTDEEGRGGHLTTSEDSDFEDAEKLRFRKRPVWKRIAQWRKEGNSEDDIQALILQSATDQLKPFIPLYNDFSREKIRIYIAETAKKPFSLHK